MGNGPVASLLIRQVEEMKSGKIKGILWTENGTWPGEYEGYQVLGSISNLPNAIKASKADTLLVQQTCPGTPALSEILSRKKFKNLTIRWVPHEVFEQQNDILHSEIKLNTFSV